MLNASPDGTTWILTLIALGAIVAVASLFLLIGHTVSEIAKTRQAAWHAREVLHRSEQAKHEALQKKSEEAIARMSVRSEVQDV